MSRAEFLAINETRSKLGQKLLANPRNAAAGAVRKKDPAETAKRGLRFFAYATGELSQALAPYQSELVAELSRLGFVTNQIFATFDTLERSEEHTSELQSLMRISYAVVCFRKKKKRIKNSIQAITSVKKKSNRKFNMHLT